MNTPALNPTVTSKPSLHLHQSHEPCSVEHLLSGSNLNRFYTFYTNLLSLSSPVVSLHFDHLASGLSVSFQITKNNQNVFKLDFYSRDTPTLTTVEGTLLDVSDKTMSLIQSAIFDGLSKAFNVSRDEDLPEITYKELYAVVGLLLETPLTKGALNGKHSQPIGFPS